MKRAGKYLLAFFISALLLLTALGLTFLAQIPFYLTAGWIYFLIKTVPQVTLDLPAIGLAVVALLLLVFGVQRAGQAWQRSSSDTNESNRTAGTATWHFRWTLTCVFGLLLLFTAGISVVGAIHQLVWLAWSAAPLTENSFDGIVGQIQSKNTLKTIGLAALQHAEDRGSFPAGATFNSVGQPMHSWTTALLPYLNQQHIYESINLTLPWNAPENEHVFQTNLAEFQNPWLVSHPSEETSMPAAAHYAANTHLLGPGFFFRPDEVTDGLSQTVMLGEVAAEFRSWGDPLNVRDPTKGLNADRKGFASPHRGNRSSYVIFLMGDGSVRSIDENIAAPILEALSTPQGGEDAGEF